MAVAYINKEDGELVLFAARGEVGPKKRNGYGSGVYWALTAFLALAEEEVDQFPITQWRFKLSMKEAMERILSAKGAILEYLDPLECDNRVKAVLSESKDNLNPAVIAQLQVDKEAGLV
jgi:hypothetical protein